MFCKAPLSMGFSRQEYWRGFPFPTPVYIITEEKSLSRIPAIQQILISCLFYVVVCIKGFPGGSVVKNLPANAGDAGLILGLGRFPGEGNGNPLQHSCLGNPTDRRA